MAESPARGKFIKPPKREVPRPLPSPEPQAQTSTPCLDNPLSDTCRIPSSDSRPALAPTDPLSPALPKLPGEPKSQASEIRSPEKPGNAGKVNRR